MCVHVQRYDIRSRRQNQSSDDNGYFTELQYQAEERHKQLQKEKETNKDLDLQHMKKMETTWNNNSSKASPRPRRPPVPEEGTAQQRLMKKREYCNELRKMIDDRHTERRKMKESSIHSDKQVGCVHSNTYLC